MPWGVFSTLGYHPLKFEYHGAIMIHVGDIMSTVGDSNNKRF